jgi:outer membrane protein OmpA-like peptidoglycan-associated protein
MTARTAIVGLCAIGLGVAFGGCSFSASASAGSRASLVGKEKIVVSADQPAPRPKRPKSLRKAKVVGKKIEITEKVMFDTAKATIKPESHELLSDVADVMKEHANIKRVRIEGHTDADGTDEYNKTLSDDRAAAVMAFLVDAGVEEDRMEAVGYGEEKPIADNETDEGKYKNRRVEFNIIKQTRGGR